VHRLPIRWRLTAWYATLLAVALLCFGAGVYIALRIVLYQNLEVTVQDQTDLALSTVGLDKAGNGAMTFTLVGPTYYPSAAYIKFSTSGPSGPIQVAAAGVAPEDGFSCYRAFGGDGVCRWGDYSTAVAADGAIFMATEYIPGPRTDFANWGTFIMRYPL